VKESVLISLDQLGWTASREAEFESLRGGGLVPGRVTEEQRNGYRVLAADGEFRAVLPGRLRFRADDRHELPAVGDWVALDPRPAEGTAVVFGVLPRTSALVRRSLDVRTSAQVVAANLDTVFLMSSVNRDFNPRRIERYLALIREKLLETRKWRRITREMRERRSRLERGR
jgi:ribosome biogenesis GTPase